MKNNIKMILTLGLISALSGFLLASVYKICEVKIEENRNKEIETAIFNVLPDACKYEKKEINNTIIYIGKSKTDEKLGYSWLIKGNGFQGAIVMVIGISSNLEKIVGIQILEQVETPGLGAKIAENWFQDQFKNLSIPNLVLEKNVTPEQTEKIAAITGATISSQSVVTLIKQSLSEILPTL